MCLPATAQDHHFSQFQASPLLVNPALTAHMRYDYRASLLHRRQWLRLNTPYLSSMISAEAAWKEKPYEHRRLGVGVIYLDDQIGNGDFTKKHFLLSLSGSLAVGTYKLGKLSAGVQAGVIQEGFRPGGLIFASQAEGYTFNPDIPSGENINNYTETNLNLNAGVHYSTVLDKHTFIQTGFSVLNINRPRYTLLKPAGEAYRQPRIAYTAALNHVLHPRWTLAPAAILHYQYGATEIISGVETGYQTNRLKTINAVENQDKIIVYFGLYWRYNDALVPTIKMLHKNFVTALSYDVTYSGLNRVPGMHSGYTGSVELSFAWFGMYRKQDPRKIIYPCESLL